MTPVYGTGTQANNKTRLRTAAMKYRIPLRKYNQLAASKMKSQANSINAVYKAATGDTSQVRVSPVLHGGKAQR
jgi:hypothetical protein